MNEYVLGWDAGTKLRDLHGRLTGLTKQELGGLRDDCNQVRLSELHGRIEAIGYLRLDKIDGGDLPCQSE